MKTAIKICGLSDEASVKAVIAAEADFAGFVFYPRSPRHIAHEKAAKLSALLPPHIKSVSVLVDPDDALLADVGQLFKPDYIQLHGSETPERVKEIKTRYTGIKIIKAIKVASDEDIMKASAFYDVADMLMFDSHPSPNALLPGGNGVAFDWKILRNKKFPLPYFLSGGLNEENVSQAIAQSVATMVDVSSGVESAPGVKDVALIEQFVKAARL